MAQLYLWKLWSNLLQINHSLLHNYEVNPSSESVWESPWTHLDGYVHALSNHEVRKCYQWSNRASLVCVFELIEPKGCCPGVCNGTVSDVLLTVLTQHSYHYFSWWQIDIYLEIIQEWQEQSEEKLLLKIYGSWIVQAMWWQIQRSSEAHGPL